MAQILLVPRRLAYSLPPFFNRLQDPVLHPGGPHWRSFWKTTNQLIEKLLCTDLEVERITAVLDADVEELFTSKRGQPRTSSLSASQRNYLPLTPAMRHFDSGN